jgi:hypothetical protein
MRHPLTLGFVVLGALLLALVALLHLVAARRTNGHRLAWGALSLFVPVVGPLAYLFYGRTRGAFEDDEAEADFAAEAYVSSPGYTPPPLVPPPDTLPRIAPVRLRKAPLPPLDAPARGAEASARPDEG